MKRDFVYWIGGSMFEMVLVLFATRFVNFILYGFFSYDVPTVALVIGRFAVGISAFAGAKLFDILCECAEQEQEGSYD